MTDALHLISSPVRLSGGLRLAQLVTLLSADGVARALRADGRDVTWTAGVLVGDLATQLSVERDLAREGLDRASAGRDEVAARARDADAASRVHAAEALGVLGVDVDLDGGALDNEDVVLAARTAFVRLYEAGQLLREERVVSTCPRCATVVDDIDAEAGVSASEQRRIRVSLAGGAHLDVDATATELLPGVVAIAVPIGSDAEGAKAEVPLADRVVPVVAGEGCTAPAFVVPAHDDNDFDVARRIGVTPVAVLDAEGIVVAPGPLEGLGRYAARAAANDLLTSLGAVLDVIDVEEPVSRCRRCGTVLIPRLGRHWFLPMADVEVLAADAFRQGLLDVFPAQLRDDLTARAGESGQWCLSHQVWAGEPVPVATCLDCGQVAVSVEPQTSCGKCMGTLVPDEDVLDARFVGAIWPLAIAGWPNDETGPVATAATTALLVAPTGIVLWAVRMTALGLRLAGAAPFARVLVHPAVAPHAHMETLVDGAGAADAMAAAVGAGYDVDWATDAAASLADA